MIPTHQEVPIEALTRVEALLEKDYLSGITTFGYLAIHSNIEEQRHEALKAITKVLDILFQLRREILRNLSHIDSKYQQVTIKHKYLDTISDLGDYLDRIYSELHDGIINTAEAYEKEKAKPETECETKSVILEENKLSSHTA